MKRKVYQSETDGYIEKEIIGRIKYIGRSFGIDGLTNGKIYDVVGIEGSMFRVIDDSEEDYLYSIITPGALDNEKLCGKWELVEDYTEDKDLEKVFISSEMSR